MFSYYSKSKTSEDVEDFYTIGGLFITKIKNNINSEMDVSKIK